MKLKLSFTFIFLLAVTVATQPGCTASKLAKRLVEHQNALSLAANGNATPQEKFDILAETFVSVLDESIRYTNPKKTVRHVTTFSNQNEKNIEKLTKDLSKWMSGLTLVEQLAFAGSIATKPYAADLINLIPKFERKVNRKIKTFKVLSKIGKVLSPKF